MVEQGPLEPKVLGSSPNAPVSLQPTERHKRGEIRNPVPGRLPIGEQALSLGELLIME